MSGVSSQAGIPFSLRSEHVTKAKHRHVFNDPRPSVIDGLIFHVFRLSSLLRLRPPATLCSRPPPPIINPTQQRPRRRVSIIHHMLLVQRSPSSQTNTLRRTALIQRPSLLFLSNAQTSSSPISTPHYSPFESCDSLLNSPPEVVTASGFLKYQLQYFINDAGGVSEDGLFYSNDNIGNCSILMLNLLTFDQSLNSGNSTPVWTHCS